MAEEKKIDIDDLTSGMERLSVETPRKIVAVLDDEPTTLKMIDRKGKKSKFQEFMENNGYEVKTYLGTIPFFKDFGNISDRLGLIISDFDMKTGGQGDDGDVFLKTIREMEIDVPFIIVSNNPLSDRGDFEKELNRLNASYIDSSRLGSKALFYNSESGQEEILRKIRFTGKGLSTNSYNINSVNGRNMKYNSLREQILSLSQRRGLNVSMNQTLQAINQPRFYFK
jgi:hypothetical protein